MSANKQKAPDCLDQSSAKEHSGMNNQIVPFRFEDANIRVVNREGEPWFVLADVCRVLGIANNRNVASRLDDDDKGVHTVDTVGRGRQQVTITNESGVWTAVMLSRLPDARRFKKWITSEVIPSIRKTGGYGKGVAPADAVAALRDPATLRTLLLDYAAQIDAKQVIIEQKQAVIEEQAIKVDALDRLRGYEGQLCLRDAAKALDMSERWVIKWLITSGWIYRRPGRGRLIAHSKLLRSGLLTQKIHTTASPDGASYVEHPQVMVTPKGMAHISVHIDRELRKPDSCFGPIPTDEEGGAS